MTGENQLVIPNTENYYGSLNIRMEGGKYEMSMENCDGFRGWTEIPEYLYEALLKYYEEEQWADT